jgi:hypothetical protein
MFQFDVGNEALRLLQRRVFSAGDLDDFQSFRGVFSFPPDQVASI